MATTSRRLPVLRCALPAALERLRRRPGPALGAAHLKTGSLRDVTAVAGYVLAASGRRYVLVAIVNHPDAAAARPALEALVDWAARDTSL